MMGLPLSNLVRMFFKERGADFEEMLLHEIASLTLYGAMILSNQERFGVIISFLHNLADVPGMVAKFSS